MAAQWRLLTEHLREQADDVAISWRELNDIVGGMPASAIDHYPQWWHGDRPNTRAWRAAGFEAVDIRPGVSVQYVRRQSRVATAAPQHSQPAALAARLSNRGGEPPARLAELNAGQCLVVVPCSKSKRSGGLRVEPTAAPTNLAIARRRVLKNHEEATDESLVLPAWQRYTGRLYEAAGSQLGTIAENGRLVILSGGYGVLDGQDLIGNYNRLMKGSDWPDGLLESVLGERATRSGLNVVAFAGTSTAYAKLLRRTPWNLTTGRTAYLVTMDGVRGAANVSGRLGNAVRSFVTGARTYPPETVVERLA